MSEELYDGSLLIRDSGSERLDFKYTATPADRGMNIRIVEMYHIVNHPKPGTGADVTDLRFLLPAIHQSEIFQRLRDIIDQYVVTPQQFPQ